MCTVIMLSTRNTSWSIGEYATNGRTNSGGISVAVLIVQTIGDNTLTNVQSVNGWYFRTDTKDMCGKMRALIMRSAPSRTLRRDLFPVTIWHSRILAIIIFKAERSNPTSSTLAFFRNSTCYTINILVEMGTVVVVLTSGSTMR